MSQPVVKLESPDAAIAILTLDRADKRNALSLELIQKITSAVMQAAGEPARRVLIVRGEGPAFCAGLDLLEASQAGAAEQSAEALAQMFEAICTSSLVTIAAAHGAAIGGGAGLVMACDFVVAADDLKLGFPEVHRGLVAALVTAILQRQVADRAARELVLLGQTIDAERARQIGLVNRVVPAEQIMDTALDLARQVCRGAPGAVVRSKRLLDELSPHPIRQELRRAIRYHLEARNSAEAEEGLRAFIEKRPPNWGARSA